MDHVKEAKAKQAGSNKFLSFLIRTSILEALNSGSGCEANCRYTSASDATKAMQQLDQMDIAGLKLGVKVAPMSAGETAQLAAAAARVDLDDEGKTLKPSFLQAKQGLCLASEARIASQT